MESLRPNPSFTGLGGVEAREERAEEGKEDGPSLHDVKRALKNNFRATGVIDDVTVRERRQARPRTLSRCSCCAFVALCRRKEPRCCLS